MISSISTKKKEKWDYDAVDRLQIFNFTQTAEVTQVN